MPKILPACLAAGLIGFAAIPVSAALSAADRDFVMSATSSGLAEIQAAQLAQERSSSAQVRQFAQRVLNDRTEANDTLQQIVGDEDLTLPTEPAGTDAAEVKRLGGLNGPDFDRAYAQDELRGHQRTVALFRKEANSGQDPALKDFAQKTLPMLQQHLQMAQTLSATVR